MLSKIYKEDIDVAKVLINEWKECLEGFEKDVLKLEVSSEDMNLLDNIFIRVKRIKRASSFIGLSVITGLSYETELLLKAIKDKTVAVDTELIDSLLSYIDFLNNYIKGLQKKLEEAVIDESTLYLEYEDGQNEEQLFESLKQACENCRIRDSKEDLFKENILKREDIELPESELNSNLTEGIREQFLLETAEHIERVENDLLMRLDSNSNDREAVNEIFRVIHSIKGATGLYLASLPSQNSEYLALKKFSELVHTFESLLAIIREKECIFENKLIDLSFSVMDYFKRSINSIADEEYAELQNKDILDEIREYISQTEAVTGNKSPQSPIKTNPHVDENHLTKSGVTQSIRVNQEKIDKMMNMISELFIAKNSFLHIAKKLNLEYSLPEMSKEVKQVGAYINRISDELQNTVMSIRMVEIKTVFQRMPRIVRDIAQSTGKKMELFMEGEDTEIDKTIIEQISDPLVHLIRNAADHGIEFPEERLSKGKEETGRIILRAYNKNKHVFIEIEDDGKGINTENLKNKAIEKGLISSTDAEKMSQNQLINLIFLPGLSTAKQITEISGRGVGMDIVKSNILKLNGNIMIESEADKGTKIIVQLPLSLAVSSGLIVEVAGENYIIPLEYIVETVKIKRSSIHEYSQRCFTYLRGNVIRVEWLCKIFLTGERNTENDELNAVILSNGVENYAIVVDKLKNEQEFVVKTLDGHLAAIPGISGSTLLGNGQVVLILNPIDILQLMEK